MLVGSESFFFDCIHNETGARSRDHRRGSRQGQWQGRRRYWWWSSKSRYLAGTLHRFLNQEVFNSTLIANISNIQPRLPENPSLLSQKASNVAQPLSVIHSSPYTLSIMLVRPSLESSNTWLIVLSSVTNNLLLAATISSVMRGSTLGTLTWYCWSHHTYRLDKDIIWRDQHFLKKMTKCVRTINKLWYKYYYTSSWDSIQRFIIILNQASKLGRLWI